METITSRKNPLCQHIRSLAADGEYRRQSGEFLCDSPKLLEEALKRDGTVHTVVCTERRVPAELPTGVRVVVVPEDVMASLAPSKTPQGALAVCALVDQPLPQRLTGRQYVVLDGVQDPGNVGAVLRSADAFWTDGVFLVNACADLYHPKTLRASMGAVFRCPVWTVTPEALCQLLRCSQVPLYGAALRQDTADVDAVDWCRAALAIGSEGQGLSDAVLALCDKTVKIPMREHCESLNAAAAAAVLLWEMARVRR